SERRLADAQMRRGFDWLAERLSIPALYGLSIFGTVFGIYRYDALTGDLTPPKIPHVFGKAQTDTAPVTRWNYDIMHPAGAKKLLEIVDEAKDM
ncbi:hypothetical protein JB92DRAFT_2564211, partial [Gautieria morchelliformis]